MNLDITLTKLTLRNFLSYGNNETEVNLNFGTPTLIVGRNLDAIVNGQVDSNGSGKTVLLNAIAFALYDKTISDIAKPRLINHSNKKNMMVSIEFTKNKTTFYKVVRFRKNAALGGDGIKIYERQGNSQFTDKDEKSPDSIGNATEWVANTIGIPFDVFSRIIIFSAAHQPFLMLPASSTGSAANQRDVIEELFGITELSDKAEILKKQIKENREVFDRMVEINDTLKRERASHKALLDSVTTQMGEWQVQYAHDIDACKLQVKTLSKIDIAKQIELYEKRTTDLNKLTTYELELKNFRIDLVKLKNSRGVADNWDNVNAESVARSKQDMAGLVEVDFEAESVKFQEIEALGYTITTLNSAITASNTKITNTSEKIAQLEGELEHLKDSNCPYCKQSFKDAVIRADTIGLELVDHLADLKGWENQKFQLRQDFKSFLEKKTAIFDELKFKTPSDLQREVARIEKIKSNHEFLLTATNPHNKVELDEDITACSENIGIMESNIEKVKARLEKTEKALLFASHKEAIEAASKLEAAKKRLDELTDNTKNPHRLTYERIALTEFEDLKDDDLNKLDDIIEHQNFLLKLLTKKDSFIRKLLLQKNLPFLNTRLKVYLDRMGLPHRVQFMEDLQVKISQFGSETEYGGMSSGQRARINLALSFAFRDVLQARHGRINFCILDECLDVGLGTVGVQLAADLIKSIAIQDKLSMFVITHKDEISSMFDSKLEIELENGFSRIVNVE